MHLFLSYYFSVFVPTVAHFVLLVPVILYIVCEVGMRQAVCTSPMRPINAKNLRMQ
jgi:hypothetical protein